MVGLVDDRPRTLVAKAEVGDDVRANLAALVEAAHQAGVTHGVDIQAEFGKQHVALIAKCNQFARIYRRGEHAGSVEILPNPTLEKELTGLALQPAIGGAVFAMFGWQTVAPDDTGRLPALIPALVERALAPKASTLA